jgi:hypothetical protein
MGEKKPDNIVWNKEDGYNANILPYASNVGAPAIQMDDIGGWKNRQVVSVNHQIKTKFEELREEYNKLIDEYNWNQLIYKSRYSFVPVIPPLCQSKRRGVFIFNCTKRVEPKICGII